MTNEERLEIENIFVVKVKSMFRKAGAVPGWRPGDSLTMIKSGAG